MWRQNIAYEVSTYCDSTSVWIYNVLKDLLCKLQTTFQWGITLAYIYRHFVTSPRKLCNTLISFIPNSYLWPVTRIVYEIFQLYVMYWNDYILHRQHLSEGCTQREVNLPELSRSKDRLHPSKNQLNFSVCTGFVLKLFINLCQTAHLKKSLVLSQF